MSKNITPDDYKHDGLLVPVSSAKVDTTGWVIPGVLPPGMVLVAGDPKSFKTRFTLSLFAVALRLIPSFLGDIKLSGKYERKRVVYLAREQGPGTVRRILEQHVIGRPFKKGEDDWDFAASSDPGFRFDEPATLAHDIPRLIQTWQPDIVGVDPLIYFHNQDENDPRLVNFIAPAREAALRRGACLVIVHHANKGGGQQAGGDARPWSRIRGTSALWGMADGAFYLSAGVGDTVTVRGEWKEAPARVWNWRPGEMTDDKQGRKK